MQVEDIVTNSQVRFVRNRPTVDTSVDATLDGHVVNKGLLVAMGSLNTEGNTLGIGKTLVGTTREVAFTDLGSTLVAGLPDVVKIGSVDNYTSSGTDTGILIIGTAQVGGTTNKTHSLFVGSNSNTIDSQIDQSIIVGQSSIIDENAIIDASLYVSDGSDLYGEISGGSIYSGSGNRIGNVGATGLIDFGSYMLGRTNILEGTVTNGSLFTGFSSSIFGSGIATLGSVIMGTDQTIYGEINEGMMLGNLNFIGNVGDTGVVKTGSVLMGNNNKVLGTVSEGSIFAGNSSDVNGSGTINGGSLVSGENVTINGFIDQSAVLADDTTIYGNVWEGSLILGQNNSLGVNGGATGVMRTGSVFMGNLNTGYTGTIQQGSVVGGYANRGGQLMQTGSLVFGRGNEAQGSILNGSLLMGYLNYVEKDTTSSLGSFMIGRELEKYQSTDSYSIGSRQYIDKASGNPMYITAGTGPTVSTRFYNASTANRYYFDSSTVSNNDIIITTNGEIQAAGGTFKFYDSRPVCDEDAHPTTGAFDLVSKQFAEAYTAGDAGDWATSTPTTIKAALDRIAAYVATNHAPIPL